MSPKKERFVEPWHRGSMGGWRSRVQPNTWRAARDVTKVLPHLLGEVLTPPPPLKRHQYPMRPDPSPDRRSIATPQCRACLHPGRFHDTDGISNCGARYCALCALA